MNIAEGDKLYIENFLRLIHKLKVITIVSLNPGYFVPDHGEVQMNCKYIRLAYYVQ